MFSTHILESLEAAPPVTLATRSWDNSFFRSSSCFSSSSFFLPRRSLALILAWMTEKSKHVVRRAWASNTPSARLTLTTQDHHYHPYVTHSRYWGEIFKLFATSINKDTLFVPNASVQLRSSYFSTSFRLATQLSGAGRYERSVITHFILFWYQPACQHTH